MKTPPKPTPHTTYTTLIMAGLIALASCGPTIFSDPDAPIPQDQGLVQINLPREDNRSLNSVQTQGYTDYYEVIFNEKNTSHFYAGTGRTGDTVTLQVPGGKYYEILILGGYASQNRNILLGSVFANKLTGEHAGYDPTALTGILITGGTRTTLSFTLDPLLLEPTKDYTVEFSFSGVLDTDGKPERINERLAALGDTQNPLQAQQEPEQLSITVSLAVPSLMRAEPGTWTHFAEVQGRFDVYDPAEDRFIYYALMKPRGPWYLTAEALALGFTLPVGTIQGVSPADGDWKFDFEATYYGFGTAESGGTKWIIRNGLGSDLDREGGIGGGLWVRFGNGFQDRELRELHGTVKLNGNGVPGAEVQLLTEDRRVYKAATSGWDGRYSFGDIVPGSYTLEATLMDTITGKVFCCTEEGVTVPGAGLPVNLELEEGYRVSYALNGGGGTPPASRIVVPGTKITLPGGKGMTPPESGTAFLRWEEGGTTYKGGKEYTVTRDVRFTATWGEFTRVDEVTAHLASFIDGEGATVADCISVPVGIDFTSGGSDTWEALLEALETAGKYVALDLSHSTLTGMTTVAGEFDPGTYNTGEPYIGSLTLPDAALSIKAGTSSSTATFQHFTALQSISGANIETIGDYAFYDGDGLSSVYLPAAKTIGTYAFYDGAGLSTVYLPVATDIGTYAFYNCDGLSSVYLPAATGIGTSAFQNCDRLSTVILPVATSIGINAFLECVILKSVSLPKAESILQGAFARCPQLKTVDLPEVKTIGRYAFENSTALSTVSIPKVTAINQYTVFQACPLTSITISSGCTISAVASLRSDFTTYYNAHGLRGGTYLYVGGAWTGPF